MQHKKLITKAHFERLCDIVRKNGIRLALEYDLVETMYRHPTITELANIFKQDEGKYTAFWTKQFRYTIDPRGRIVEFERGSPNDENLFAYK